MSLTEKKTEFPFFEIPIVRCWLIALPSDGSGRFVMVSAGDGAIGSDY